MGPKPKRLSKKEQHAAAQTAAAAQSIPDEIPASFESPESTTILGGTYDAETHTMVVKFKQTNRTASKKPDSVSYAYSGIQPELWRDFFQADSKGHFFQAMVRPFYVGRKQ